MNRRQKWAVWIWALLVSAQCLFVPVSKMSWVQNSLTGAEYGHDCVFVYEPNYDKLTAVDWSRLLAGIGGITVLFAAFVITNSGRAPGGGAGTR